MTSMSFVRFLRRFRNIIEHACLGPGDRVVFIAVVVLDNARAFFIVDGPNHPHIPQTIFRPKAHHVCPGFEIGLRMAGLGGGGGLGGLGGGLGGLAGGLAGRSGRLVGRLVGGLVRRGLR